MKKLISFLMVISVVLVLCSCGSSEKTDAPQTTAEALDTQKNNDEIKIVYWATKDKESSDVCYHTKDCKVIKDKVPEELSWEIINALGMPACKICKP